MLTHRPGGRRVAVMTASGGQAELILDLATVRSDGQLRSLTVKLAGIKVVDDSGAELGLMMTGANV